MAGEHDFADDLTSRVRRAIAVAQETVARSEALAAASRLVQDPSLMMKRCAWCGRLALGRWTTNERVPSFVTDRMDGQTTHGICADCLRRLERTGRSRPLKRASDSRTSPSS